jgi:hypothetical protein
MILLNFLNKKLTFTPLPNRSREAQVNFLKKIEKNKQYGALNPSSRHTSDDSRLRHPNPQHGRVPAVIKVQQVLPSVFTDL